MADLQCPFCHTSVPRGATVCRGCQAEVEYGSPQALIAVIGILAAAAGGYIGTNTNQVAGWVTFLVLGIGGIVLSNVALKNQVRFKRSS